jgi:hypothetical protein
MQWCMRWQAQRVDLFMISRLNESRRFLSCSRSASIRVTLHKKHVSAVRQPPSVSSHRLK